MYPKPLRIVALHSAFVIVEVQRSPSSEKREVKRECSVKKVEMGRIADPSFANCR